ncbi:FtsW/RodA/SpoVE family cell cycle protein [Brevibacillus sp. B_LB10_24]|uniref:FtsW/RodA/SpoVE family cell cycle protein n=1 Tax=Brevibacillus sp. B_LB10_24 TaxID=3380645 RepID=UPI0038B741FB
MPDAKKREAFVYIALLCLLTVSLIAIYTATREYTGQKYVVKQLIWACLGGGLLLFLRNCDYHRLSRYSIWLYVMGIAFLLSVFLLGKKVNGALSWINLGFVSVQPSELARITTLFLLARLYEQQQGVFHRSWPLLQVLLVLMIPMATLLLQPDLGMALVYLSMLGCFFVLTKLSRWMHAGALLCCMLLVIGLYSLHSISPRIFYEVVRPHQFERLTSFLHPEADPLGSGYQYIKARKVVGSGQLSGTNLLRLLPMAGGRLPEQHTDFIFAVIAQQWGFIGASVLLLLYLLLFYRLVQWAMATPDPFAAFFISGMVTMWAFQIFVNIGMNIGLSPITGLPLPFVSYGGSSLVTNMLALGLIVSMKEPKPDWSLE